MLRNIVSLLKVIHDFKLSEDKKEQLVKRRLRDVLASSYRYVPYYRNIMKEIGYNPLKDYTGPDDLIKLPITTKKDLKKYGIKYFLKEGITASTLFNDSTSGSTGIPFEVYRNKKERAFQIANWLRVLFLNGYNARDKVLSITSPERVNEGRTVLQKFGFLQRNAVNYLLPASSIVDIILDYKPEVLYGNRSHLDLIAMEFLRRGIIPKNLRLLFTGGEVIDRNNRNLYKKAFNLNVLEFYGTVESGIIAFQYQNSKGLYLCDDLTWLEFLDEDGNQVSPGVPGRVVVTNLINKTMPFIRYDQGDYAITKIIEGRNGKPIRIISKIIGRDEDKITLQNGTLIPFHNFNLVMKKYRGIIQFRVIQNTVSDFQIYIFTDQDYFNKVHTQIIVELYKIFPEYCKFNIFRTDAIKPDSSGKLRRFISRVKKN